MDKRFSLLASEICVKVFVFGQCHHYVDIMIVLLMVDFIFKLSTG
jgi:phage-related holin